MILTVPEEPELTKPMSAPGTPPPALKQAGTTRPKGGGGGVSGVATSVFFSKADDGYKKLNPR